MRFTADGPFADQIGPEQDNLVVRAACLMADVCRPATRDIDIHLTKRLPVAAGIGGGSSDAAAALRALNRYWEAGLDDGQLAEMGLTLGADVPMCLSREPIFVSGIGEKVTPAPSLPLFSLLMINPGVAVATPAVFKAWNGKASPSATFTEEPRDAAALAQILKDRGNDLSDPALCIAPVIGEVLEAIDHQSGCLLSRMSGSGATCFGLFADAGEAENARHVIHLAHPDWWCDAMMLF